MIRIHVGLSSQLYQKAHNPPEFIELQPPCTFQDAVRVLAEGCGEEFSRLLFDDRGVLRSTILLSLNDAQILWDDHQLLSDGDRIDILSPIAGG